MDKLTYTEFGELVAEMGYKAWLDYIEYAKVTDNRGATVAVVHKKQYKALSLDWIAFNELTDDDRDLLADACWRLASTPLKYREEPKYYLKVNTKIMPGAPETESYLCVKRDRSRWMILEKFENEYHQTKFTDEEIKGLEEVLDLTLFERVEVEDD